MINKLALKSGIHRYPLVLKALNLGRLKPDIFIVGFQKCGTTTLYRQLSQIKGVRVGLIKENDTLALKNGDPEVFQLSFPYGSSTDHALDASHLHTYTPFGIQRIKLHYSNARLVMILRDPVDRAYSHFNMDQKNGYIPTNWSFEDYISIELELRKRIPDPNDVASIYKSMKLFHSKYGWALTRSIYHPYVKMVQDSGLHYHVLFLEDLTDNYSEEFKNLLSFLNLDASNLPSLQAQNQGSYNAEILQSTRDQLEELFKPHNERLKSLLDVTPPWMRD
jgi:hypothetical protein